MIFAKFLWGNVLFGGKLRKDAKNSNFEFFESALYMKPVSMPLSSCKHVKPEKSDEKTLVKLENWNCFQLE